MPTILPKFSGLWVELWCRWYYPLSAASACVSGYGLREEGVCHVSFVCAAFSSLYARSSSVWPVCPASSLLFYFTFCLWMLTSPSYSQILCLTSRFELLFLSPSQPHSLSLSPSPSHLFDALMVGWMTEAIRLFHPHTHTLSCPVLHCWFLLLSPIWKRRQCDSDAEVGGMGAGGWLNGLTASSSNALAFTQERYPDKEKSHSKLETVNSFSNVIKSSKINAAASLSCFGDKPKLNLICLGRRTVQYATYKTLSLTNQKDINRSALS